MQCPRCKAELNRQAQFCWKCGAAIASETAPSAPARPTAAAPQKRGSNRWMAAVALLLLLLAVIVLIATRGSSKKPVVTAAHEGGVPAAQPVTAAVPDSRPAPPVTAAPPSNPNPGPPLPQANARPRDYDDVAAYLRKLEVIEQRDSQNQTAQLAATMGAMLSAATSGLQGLNNEGGPEKDAGKQIAQANRTFNDVMQNKAGIQHDFGNIAPVPLSCRLLHNTYWAYLSAQTKAISELQSAVQSQNMAAPLTALPLGQAAEVAKAAAMAQEDALRKLYGIPRTVFP